MRDIKFRLWLNDYQKYIQVAQMVECNDGLMHYFTDDNAGTGFYDLDNQKNILEQFTGLKDKNGKEIFEGDKCKVFDDPEDAEIAIVQWDDEMCGFLFITPCESFVYCDVEPEIEVIGNIHQS